MFVVLMLSCVMAIDPKGEHFDDVIENIQITEKKERNFFESFFTIYPVSQVEPGDDIEFNIEQRSWNYVHCDDAWAVVEIYKNGQHTGTGRYHIGEVNPQGTKEGYKFGVWTVTVETSKSWGEGTFEAVDYMYCASDHEQSQWEGGNDEVDHTGQQISTEDTITFEIKETSSTYCQYDTEGWQTETKSCVATDIHMIYVINLDTCSYETQLYDECDYDCSSGKCLDGECNSDDDCQSGYVCNSYQCEKQENKGCIEDSDCSSGYECIAFECEKESTPYPHEDCNSDGECPEGYSCVDYICEDDGDEEDNNMAWYFLASSLIILIVLGWMFRK